MLIFISHTSKKDLHYYLLKSRVIDTLFVEEGNT